MNTTEITERPVPDRATQARLDSYTRRFARNIAIAVACYILSAAVLILCSALYDAPILGILLLLIIVAGATGLIVYTNLSVPADLKPYMNFREQSQNEGTSFDASFFKLFWLVVTIIYLAVSFWTMRFEITWIIWLIAAAIKEAICLFAGLHPDK